jgi:hypothetical protein
MPKNIVRSKPVRSITHRDHWLLNGRTLMKDRAGMRYGLDFVAPAAVLLQST